MDLLKKLGTASGYSFLALASLLSPVVAAVAGEEAGASLDLNAWRGKVVVVDFWASWCAPCRRSFPWLESMHRKYRDEGLVVIGINEDNARKDADAFLEQFPVTFRIVRDPEGDLARRFDVVAMPSTYLIGRDGELVDRHLGFKTSRVDEYESILRRLLDAEPAPARTGR